MQLLSLLLLLLGLLVPARPAPVPEPVVRLDEMRESFLSRCDKFPLVDLLPQPLNCSRLWAAFENAVNSGGCSPQESNFEDLISLADQRVPENQSVFWSGVSDLIPKMKNLTDRFTVDKSLLGYILNDSPHWECPNCSANFSNVLALLLSTPAPKVEPLQDPVACTNFTLPFWRALSTWFAKKASGRASVILNASVNSTSNMSIFRNTTIFATHELPWLLSSRVPHMDIYLVNSLEDPKTSGACDEASVTLLRALLDGKGIAYTCTQNPDFLMHLLCADQPKVSRCRIIGGSTPGGPRPGFGRLGTAAIALALAGALNWARASHQWLL